MAVIGGQPIGEAFMRNFSALLFAVLLFGAPNAAQANCDSPPGPVRAWLKSHPGWSLVRETDLAEVSGQVWKHLAKPGLCPGFAGADLDGSGRLSYMALFLKAPDGLQLLFRPDTSVPENLTGEASIEGSLIYRVKPGYYWDFEAEKNVFIARDGFKWVSSDGPTSLFFLKGRHIKRIVIFD